MNRTGHSINSSGYYSLNNSVLLKSEKLSQVQVKNEKWTPENDDDHFYSVFKDECKVEIKHEAMPYEVKNENKTPANDDDFYSVFEDEFKVEVKHEAIPYEVQNDWDSIDWQRKFYSLRRRAKRNQAKMCRGLIFGDDEFNINKKFKNPIMTFLQSVSNVTKTWLSIYKRPQFYEPYMESVHKERIQLNLAFSYFMFFEQIGPITVKLLSR